MTRRVPISEWKLTQAEANVMDVMVATGCRKAAARRLEISAHTVASHTEAARRKMQVENTTRATVLWDRFRRGGATL